MKHQKVNVAVVGATGAVGTEMLREKVPGTAVAGTEGTGSLDE